MTDIRKEVIGFAEQMELKLRRDDGKKGGWDDLSIQFLFSRIQDEVKELEEEINNNIFDNDAVVKECADVANFCMMLAQNVNKDN